jgi:hypothetical protein
MHPSINAATAHTSAQAPAQAATAPATTALAASGPTSAAPLYITIGPETWSQAVVPLLALVQDGTSEGRRMAREQVQSMARAADLAASAVALLNRMLEQQRTTHPEVARDIERLLQRAGLLRSVSIVDSTSSEG